MFSKGDPCDTNFQVALQRILGYLMELVSSVICELQASLCFYKAKWQRIWCGQGITIDQVKNFVDINIKFVGKYYRFHMIK